MNKNLLPVATLLALSLAWVGCNKSGKLAEPSTFTTPSGPVELKLKWPKGERVVQDMDLKQNMEFTIPGQPAPVKQDMTMGQEYGLTVLSESPDGGHEVEMEFLNARMGSTMGGKTLLNYDSSKSSSADKTNPVAAIFGKIVGSKIRFFLNASNEVDRIEGVDALVDRLTSGGQADALTPIKSMFNEGYFKQMMSANRFMPHKAVQPGDTWPVQIEFPMGAMGTMVMNYTFTFESWQMHGKRNCARLEFQGTITTKPDPNSKPAGMSMSILDGNTSGVSWFDPEIGKTIDTRMNQDMKMVIKMPMNPRAKPDAAGQMQSMTNQMNQAITIKLVSVK
ncbi:MAG: DUF6263 family protein [Verrucomicrobiales bacterium]|nr:DUF6263 family protein [Verrucomicrobiales bacterium]